MNQLTHDQLVGLVMQMNLTQVYGRFLAEAPEEIPKWFYSAFSFKHPLPTRPQYSDFMTDEEYETAIEEDGDDGEMLSQWGRESADLALKANSYLKALSAFHDQRLEAECKRWSELYFGWRKHYADGLMGIFVVEANELFDLANAAVQEE